MEGKSCLVTGASAGIGKETALRCIRGGAYHVVVVARDSERLLKEFSGDDLTEKQRKSICFVSADLSTAEGCTKACEEALKACGGSLDLLVNNVGGARLGCSIDKATDDDFIWHFGLNVRPCYLMVSGCRDALIKAKGAVVNLSSIAASQVMHGLAPYCIAKAAVEHLTRCQANELTKFGVRVNAVAPGTISTEFHVRAGMPAHVATEYYKDPTGRHPLGRVGTPEEIADAIMFLASSQWTTGSVLVVDGGRQLLCGPESKAPGQGKGAASGGDGDGDEAASGGAGDEAGAGAGESS